MRTVTIPNHFLCDIKTGALITFPIPGRLIDATNQQIPVAGKFAGSCPGHADDMTTYACNFVISGTAGIADRTP